MHVSCPKYRIFLQKTWTAWVTTLKFFSRAHEGPLWKSPENDFFVSGAIHCENAIWNIQIFAFNSYELKYLRGRFGRSVQLVPKNLENWRETVQRSMLRFEVLCFFSTRQESETALDYIEILKYFLWNNWTVKNGGRWGIQTQIPYWPIYIGIAA